MKTQYTIVFLFCSLVLSAQMGIGTKNPHTSAILDVNVDALVQKKGFLLPRVALQNNEDVATITSPVAGMTVFSTEDAGSGAQLLHGNRVSAFDGAKWQSISTLGEIKTLKVPTEFIVASTTEQVFNDDGQLASVNSGVVEVVKWQSSEISINNLDDVSFADNEFTILNKGFYQFSGSVNVKVDVSATAHSQIVLVLQSSTDGSLWTDFYSTSVPVDIAIAGKVRTIPVPRFIKELSANERVRMVLYKPAAMANFGTQAGIVVKDAGDQSKSFRITTIKQ